MRDKPAATLRKLIQQHGNDLTEDSRRTEALLNDLCPTYRREVFVLVNAQRQQVPADLLAAPKWMPAEAVSVRLSSRLQERLALSEEAADWAVRSWAIALGLRRNRPGGPTTWLGRARAGIRPRRAPKPDRATERQSAQLDVQSSVCDGSRKAAKPLEPTDHRVDTSGIPTGRPRLRPYGWIVAATILVALVWVFAAGTSWNAVPELLGIQRSPSRIVASLYVVPRMAWVSDGPLLVRMGPSTTEEFLSMLNAGDSVQVDKFSRDMQWSHIVDPLDGWVSNQYLHFLGPEDSTLSVRLEYQEMLTVFEDVPVHKSPDTASETLAHLAANVPAVAISVTADGQWRQIAKPVAGWVASAELAPDMK